MFAYFYRYVCIFLPLCLHIFTVMFANFYRYVCIYLPLCVHSVTVLQELVDVDDLDNDEEGIDASTDTFPEDKYNFVPATQRKTKEHVDDEGHEGHVHIVYSLLTKLKNVAVANSYSANDSACQNFAKRVPVFAGFHYITCHFDIMKSSCLLTRTEAENDRFRYAYHAHRSPLTSFQLITLQIN